MHTSCSLPLHGQASPRPAWCSGSRRQPLDVQCRNKLLRKHTRGAKAADKSKPPPRLDYVGRMRAREADPKLCPLLMFAPMENLADRPYRVALANTVGGFDEACTEFMRVPGKAVNVGPAVRGVCVGYDAWELASAGAALGAQIMGSRPDFLAIATEHLAGPAKRASRVDLNCGCPANTVTGNGAGSSLLRTPHLLHDCAKAMVQAAGGQAPVSVKMRAGYDDTSLFEENLLAAQEAGAAFITIHPRTKRQTYEGRADWGLIARARQLLRIPVVGNGDVVSVAAARQLLQETGCHAIMAGRGVVQDPLLFHRIRLSFLAESLTGQQYSEALRAMQARHASAGMAGSSGAMGGDDPWPWHEPEVMQAVLRAYTQEAWGRLEEEGSDEEGEEGPLGSQASAGSSSGSSSSGEEEGGPQGRGTAAASAGSSSDGCGSSYDSCEGGEEDGHSSRHKLTQRGKFGKVKKVMKYMFNATPELAVECDRLLRVVPGEGAMHVDELLEACCKALERHWPARGPTRLVLLDHMSKNKGNAVQLVGGEQQEEAGQSAGRADAREPELAAVGSSS